jgi:hypothetical protein
MGTIKELNSIRNIGRVVGLLYIFIDIFAPLSMLYVPQFRLTLQRSGWRLALCLTDWSAELRL